ncbi:winged helix-turn-helix transcriptional regulator [Kocuria sp. HSID16901]|uniref:winged helix-turn-helix transcriptional regulator n=1 Tax=Kocuria sp. HSID16901 TaxID=2419505 RepID=UPI000660E1CC|nr:response regulator transcription factor [Kocuria sp. HSID16901]MCT1368339.1 response regulator transcription factor [Rothia sp. p3-SID1597]RUQ23353.1 DNA-binding response regulator [Kocuria sp. HSID16901]
MATILVLSDTTTPGSEPVPSLELLNHKVSARPVNLPAAEIESTDVDVIFLDGREGLVTARNTAQMLKGAGLGVPVVMVLTEGGMAAVSDSWMVDDVMLTTAGPAEVEARIRLAGVRTDDEQSDSDVLRCGDVVVDEASYSAKAGPHTLNLTYKEFELLKFMVLNAGRVFTRAQLLSEVWGYDYYGGTRTVDVHIRRLRAKLGPDHDQLITTVRNVGYSFTELRHPASDA